jgi:antitoxin VapB
MEAPMKAHDRNTKKRRVRLFRNGRSQAVRIPKEFEFQGNEVTISRGENGDLILSEKKPDRISPILDWLRKNGPIEDFPGDPGYDDLLPLDDVKL